VTLLAALAALALAAPAGGVLTLREAAGRQIYREGTSPSGRPISAFLAGTSVPASAVACATCHGPDGSGRPEGGVVPPPVGWSELARKGGHVHDAGRRHPAFDRRSAIRAITEGVDPAGNALDPAMPRFSLSREDAESLVAYLRVVEREADPGVGEKALRVATVLPTAGRAAAVGEVMRRVLEASFAELNAGGGLHGRRLVLAVAGYDSDRGGAAEALAALVAADPPFALVSGLAPGAAEALAALAERERLPLVAPFTAETPGPRDGGRYVFYAFAGLREQARALARAAARERPARARAAVLHGRDPALAAAGEAAAAELRAAGFEGVDVVALEAGRIDPDLARRLGDEVPVLLLGGERELAALLRGAAEAGTAPDVHALAQLAARAAAQPPPEFRGRIRLAFPAAPGGERPGAADALGRLRERAGLEDVARPAQVCAATAAVLLAEGLRRAGRSLSRERLVAALEGLADFDAGGLVPPVTFGPGRRVGAPGAWVLALEPGRGDLAGATRWVAVE
jgi:ABC-type branched-subunit amino acid transport system substrate-binding protein